MFWCCRDGGFLWSLLIPTLAPIAVAGVIFLILYRIRRHGGGWPADDAREILDGDVAPDDPDPRKYGEKPPRLRR